MMTLEETKALNEIQVQTQRDMEQLRHNLQLQAHQPQLRMSAITTAHSILIENARAKPVEQRDISAQDVVNFANTLINYVNG